ncbi:hypothetical protein BpHYR1_037284 [Brachionus plicatilis]|uniref:Uncharacterized protein n=1 Tax=Brachionus plicatilis TaxID=10195 RepID=A0A3M7QLZ4_BRAPC|nr:hypothetical protein BpHYR1_037284 [Brachionus plicatilis]
MIERSIIYIDLDQDINSRAVHNSPRHLHNLGDKLIKVSYELLVVGIYSRWYFLVVVLFGRWKLLNF